MNKYFENLFRGMTVPVLACKNDAGLEIVYENFGARMLLNPTMEIEYGQAGGLAIPLGALLRFDDTGEFDAFMAQARQPGGTSGYVAGIYNFEGQITPVSLTANPISSAGQDYLVFYIYTSQAVTSKTGALLSSTFHLAYSAPTTDEAIDNILAFIGDQAQVSRSYIFESISETTTSNTYEWCAAGVEPAKAMLQNLDKDDYSYDTLIARGLFVVSDITTLPADDREVLEPQGIKSLAIIPLFDHGSPLGYVGFDDCERCRQWSAEEIQLLKDVCDILASLIVRRNMERGLERTLNILQTITDNTDSVVYVNDPKTYEVRFVNKALADSLNMKPEDVIGKPCWQTLQKDMDGPCPFCPMEKMLDPGGDILTDDYSWEFCNTTNGKWYLLRDSIIKWTDGRQVHMETATEITNQKVYEEQLKHIASTDMMTGVYNREWGYQIICKMLQDQGARQEISLVFIDLDGLKKVNDSFGHEAGDRMIISTVETIKACVRKSDVICRWGGDEFILLLRCDTAQASRIMDNIQKKLDAINTEGKMPFMLGFSYGIVALDASTGDTIDTLVSLADQLMYSNKMSKRCECN